MIPALITMTTLGAFQSTDIESYIQSTLKDLSFTATVEKSSQKELEKIDGDYRRTFAFQSIKVMAKEPFKLRLEARADDTTILYIINGTSQIMRVPKIGVNQRTDLSEKPGRRQTWMDFGMLSSSVVNKFFESKFVRFDRATGNPIFDLTYPSTFNNKTRHRIWIDKSDKYTVKREWYGQSGQLKGTLLYSNPVKEGGVAFPSKFQVFNSDNKLAAEMKYGNFKINDGLSDDLFKI